MDSLTDMETKPDKNYTEKLLRDAMELLDDASLNLGLFQRQYYFKLKNRVKQHLRQDETPQQDLNIQR